MEDRRARAIRETATEDHRARAIRETATEDRRARAIRETVTEDRRIRAAAMSREPLETTRYPVRVSSRVQQQITQ